MATTSLKKVFVVQDTQAYERYQSAVKKAESDKNREVRLSPSLERGRKLLKQFSFH